MKYTLEICAGSYYDALEACKGQADRIELNSALHLGGLTPSLASLILTKTSTDLKVICMVRPRGGGFCYGEADTQTMYADAKLLLENGADGIAFGFLNEDYTIDIPKTEHMVSIIKQYNKEAVFHRAFDCTDDPYSSIETLIKLKIGRVLTSGQRNKAMEGKELIKDLQSKYGNQIEILAGSGINSTNAIELINYTKISKVHSSCKEWLFDSTTSNTNVSYSYNGKDQYDVVSSIKVKELKDSLCGKQ